MLLLAVLLAQLVSPSDDESIAFVPTGNIPGMHRLWEELTSACRRLPYGSSEGQFACHRRDVVGIELSRMGWCVKESGLRFEWEMCPRR